MESDVPALAGYFRQVKFRAILRFQIEAITRRLSSEGFKLIQCVSAFCRPTKHTTNFLHASSIRCPRNTYDDVYCICD